MATLYLPLRQLATFIRQEAHRCVTSGDLEGLLIAGLSADGMQLLQVRACI